MIGRLFRAMTHARRLARARWDLAYFESAVAFYNAELARQKRKVDAIENERNEIAYPLPRAVRNREPV